MTEEQPEHFSTDISKKAPEHQKNIQPPDPAQEQKKLDVLKEMIEAPVSIYEIDSLKELTTSKEIEIASGDLEAHVRSYEGILRGKKRKNYYHDLVFALIQIRLPEEEAKKDWYEILKHKYTTSKTLGRNIGIHVATLDYYTNIKRYVQNPKIVDANEYVDTASHAISDELTRAYNRRFFDSELCRLFRFADAFERTFSLIMLDLDYFKMYNDLNGHIRGDIALMEAVRIFHAVAGLQARVCRYGGEEFAILLSDLGIREAMDVSERIRQAVFDYRFLNEHGLPGNRLTVSGGVVEYNRTFPNASTLLDAADKALYRAKKNGRNRVEAHDCTMDNGD